MAIGPSPAKLFSTLISITLGTLLLLSACSSENGGNSDNSDSSEENSDDGEDCFDCGTSQAAFLHLDSENLGALLSVDPETLSMSSLSGLQAQTDEDTESSPLQGVDESDGDIRDALRCFTEESTDSFDVEGSQGLAAECWEEVPRIVTIAECDDIIYLVFEYPFIARTVTPDGQSIEDYSDPWSSSSPFTCQLFRTREPITDYEAGDRVQTANLEPVLCELEVNTWDRRRNIQFDGRCNLYLTAHTPGQSQDTLIRIPPEGGEEDLTEVINANICYDNYLVTTGGDVHYTGRTTSGSDCGGDSFYRMVSSGTGSLTEIMRDWWNFVFEPALNGNVYVYGPDPTQDGVASWDSACLFEFDGSETGDDRYTQLVNCIDDWWRFVQEGPDEEFLTNENDTEEERCAVEFDTYRGSNAPEKILTIDRNGDDSYEVCTVADVERKKAGTFSCNICIDGDTGHCTDSSGDLTTASSQGTCQGTTGNTWSTSGNCFNDQTGEVCTRTQPSGWDLNHDWCEEPGSSWSLTYAALSCVLADKSVEMLSSTSESVTNAWAVGNRLLYSSVEDGVYKLNAVTFTEDGTAVVTELFDDIEIYEISGDPTEGVDGLLLNGLRFSDNSYVFGAYNFGAGEDEEALNLDTGFTGLVETILIIGGN